VTSFSHNTIPPSEVWIKKRKKRSWTKLSDPEIKSEWESYQENIGRLTEYFKNSGEYTLQTPEVAGETATYKNDLSKLFFERVFHLVDDDAYLSQVLPGLIVNGEGSKIYGCNF